MERCKDLSEHKGIWVFVEVQDHERILEGSLELLTKGRALAKELDEPLTALLFGLEADQYLEEVKKYNADHIILCSDPALKHYDSEIFPHMVSHLIRKHKPAICLFPSTEAGCDLAPRLAQRLKTGLTSHCTDLEISYLPEYKRQLLVMKRPAFSGNMLATIICPHTMPQMAVVMPGVFKKERAQQLKEPQIDNIPMDFDLKKLRIKQLKAPTRWDKPHVPLEKSPIIVAGGRGCLNKKTFHKLHQLADLLGGEVGATRVPVFNEWCEEERMIGQTGKTVKPKLYIGFGISGQIQHTSSITEADIIVSINNHQAAPLNSMSDYVLVEDAPTFLDALINRLKKEKVTSRKSR